MEKLWSHTSLGTSLFDVCFLQQHTSLLFSCSCLHSSQLHTCFGCFFSTSCMIQMYTHLHTRGVYALITWRMQIGASYTAQWLEQICYIYAVAACLPACLVGCSIYWSHQWNDIPYIFDGEGNNSIYTNLAQGEGWNFQLMGDFFFFFKQPVFKISTRQDCKCEVLPGGYYDANKHH